MKEVKRNCKILFIFTLLCAWSTSVTAQICSGNLGENIFEDGDFGSGVPNIPPFNPGIAPGYVYVSNPPPDDGFYTITNNTTNWGSFAGCCWENIGDNSSDPNGYMMVVNASFDPGLFYEQEIDGLCENTEFVFSADIYNLAEGIRPNVSFLINGVSLFNTGDIPFNSIWNTYGFTFSTGPGQTSITLALQNNAPGGNGNDLALDNISFQACGPLAQIVPEEVDNICEDGNPITLESNIEGSQYDTPVYQWQRSFDNGITWEDIPGENAPTIDHTNLNVGLYFYRYLLANDPANLTNSKCRVNSNVKIVNVVPKFYEISDTLCQGLIYNFNGQQLTESGSYVTPLISSIGCDSIVTLALTMISDNGFEAVYSITDPSCNGIDDGQIEIADIQNGNPPFQILLDEMAVTVPITNLASGDYNIEIIDRFDCSVTSELSLLFPDVFNVDLGPDLEIDLGDSIFIDPSFSEPATNYTWESEGDVIFENLNLVPDYATPTNSGSLIINAIADATNCTDSDTIQIIVNKERHIYFPNIFSPNGDGSNETLTIVSAQPNVQEIKSYQIFDRWGNQVFSVQNLKPDAIELSWDGRLNGKIVDAGVYSYFAEVTFLDGVILPYVGDITVLR